MPNALVKLLTNDPPSTSPTDTIKSSQTNTALIATVGTTITAIVTLIQPELLMRILGDNPSAGARATLAVGILAAGGLVASADLFARAYSASKQSSPGEGNAVAASAKDAMFKLLDGEDSTGWGILAVTGDDAIIAKSGETPRRVKLTSLKAE